MSEIFSSVNIHVPKSVSEAMNILQKFPSCIILGGGTHILSRPDYYPNQKRKNMMNIANIPELSAVHYSENWLETGSCITISKLLTLISRTFSLEMKRAIEETGSSMIRDRATVGGALLTPDVRLSLPCYLATIGSIAEIKAIRNGKVISFWTPVSKLYENDGSISLERPFLLVRVRIPLVPNVRYCFRTVGSVHLEPEQSLSFGMKYSVAQGQLGNPQMCIAFGKGGFHQFSQVCQLLSGQNLPLNFNLINAVCDSFCLEIENSCPCVQLPVPVPAAGVQAAQEQASQAQNLQSNNTQSNNTQSNDTQLNNSLLRKERARRLLITVLNDINNEYLGS